MPKFKKNPSGMKPSGFKMKGYSYPGESPLKGKKKTAQKAAAAEDLSSAQDKIAEFGDMELKSTNIMDDKSFTIE